MLTCETSSLWDFLLIDLIFVKKTVPLEITQSISAKLLELYPTSEIWVGIGWYFAGIYHTITGENSASFLMKRVGVHQV